MVQMNCQLISQLDGHLRDPTPGRLWDVGGGRCDTPEVSNLGLSLIISGGRYDIPACLTGWEPTGVTCCMH